MRRRPRSGCRILPFGRCPRLTPWGGIAVGATNAGASRKSLVLAAMIFAVAMTFIDQTIVSIAVPKIQTELHLSINTVQWVVNGYLLALAAMFRSDLRSGHDLHRPDDRLDRGPEDPDRAASVHQHRPVGGERLPARARGHVRVRRPPVRHRRA